MSDLVERLREEATELSRTAWGRLDGGQDCAISANLANEAADRIAALEAEVARLREAVRHAYSMGWEASSDSWNGESPKDGHLDLDWIKWRDEAVAGLIEP